MLEAKKINKNPYMPEKARIVRKYDLTEDVRFFQIRIINPDLVLPLTSSGTNGGQRPAVCGRGPRSCSSSFPPSLCLG